MELIERCNYMYFHFVDILFRKEKAIWGIKVACIMPGFYRTGITDLQTLKHQLDEQFNDLPDGIKDDYGDEYLNECKIF